MTPSIPIPTDNIYKFACLFGLTLIVTSIFSFVAVYSSSLDKKVQYQQTVFVLEAKVEKSKEDAEILKLNRQMLAVTTQNEKFANYAAGGVIGIGIFISFWGARRWLNKIQLRDDRLAELQIQRLEVELDQIKSKKQ